MAAIIDQGFPLSIIHFNDVYETGPRKTEPVGGASRFATAVKQYAGEQPLVLFSGDALNPSIVSTITKGRHMCQVLNQLGVHASLVGNHDLDFGFETLQRWLPLCSFPWLLSNILGPAGETLPGLSRSLTLTIKGLKVGIIGLVEEEWTATIPTIKESFAYVDSVQVAQALLAQLQAEGCQVFICLAHMRWPRMAELAQAVPGFHLMLGGHDHFYRSEFVGETLLLISGTDFRDLTHIVLRPHPEEPGKLQITPTHVEITADFPLDFAMEALIETFDSEVNKKMEREIGQLTSEFNAKAILLRTQEMPISNFIADVACKAVNADCCIINAGTIRSDSIYPAGPFTLKNLLSILPFPTDTIITLRVTGAQIWAALENGFSQYPAAEGRFPILSGLRVLVDPAKPAGQRVVAAEIAGVSIDLTREYVLATKPYLHDGLDGYTSLKGAPTIIDNETAVMLPVHVRMHLAKIKILNQLVWKMRLSRPFTKDNLKISIEATIDGRITFISNDYPTD